MDIQRDPPTKRSKYIKIGLGVAALLVVTVAVSQLDPAPMTADRAGIYSDTVRRGEMLREVRGPGTLVPEEIRWITAVTAGRVEKVHLLAGADVEAATILMELTNPDVQVQTLQADRQLTDAEAALVQLRTNLENNRLSQASTVANLRQETNDARRRALAGRELLLKGLIIPLDQQQAEERAAALAEQLVIEEARLKLLSETIASQIAVQEEQVERLRSITAFQHQMERSMVVRAGAIGVLQELPLQVGQWANPGMTLARIVPTPQRLKAVLRIPETQAGGVVIGQRAMIDTRNGIVPGRVIRIDPASVAATVTVDVALEGDLPPGARPDLNVDGTIELERLNDVLFMNRPAYGQANSTVGLFKLVDGGNEAIRVPVRLGRTSVNAVEILDGLVEGDVVILSEMSRFDAAERIRVR
jgi:multidrug efflux pump subunit AcrA (membrane-fusion protein)